ncbi:MAG: electron transport complex subunit RsxC [Lachnospiraceae bacterium]|nr:electron transport complex subunit RsxC [Lachnospiraceae bacterium]MDD3660423.1 electron transport complex subunit RsxC [Lachnospiraceae bacterium]
MTNRTFRGGLHPYDGKELSKDKPIREIMPKGELLYPLSQHIGAPAVSIVEKGERVLVGQMIAKANGFVSAPVYASVSGTVKTIEPRRVISGDMANCIIIENDELYEEMPLQDKADLASLTKQEIIERITKAGIVGMGGAGFPTHVKLSPKEPDRITYIIINCAECEPYLTSDYRRMLEEPDKIIEGLKIILQLFDQAKGIIAIEDNKPDCIDLIKKMVKDEPRIAVKSLKTKYPQGAERQLIYAVTKRSINSSMLPADAGCVVNNADTAVAIQQAVLFGKPLTSRIVTVTGDAISSPSNFKVRMGMKMSELVEEAGGFSCQPEKLISGGPMMGISLFDLEVPIVKTSSALLCLSKDDVSRWEPSACINCGKCVEVCPGRIVPSRLADYSEHGNLEAFEKANGMECCECGCCSYICPAKRQLTQSIKSMRKMILANRKK